MPLLMSQNVGRMERGGMLRNSTSIYLGILEEAMMGGCLKYVKCQWYLNRKVLLFRSIQYAGYLQNHMIAS